MGCSCSRTTSGQTLKGNDAISRHKEEIALRKYKKYYEDLLREIFSEFLLLDEEEDADKEKGPSSVEESKQDDDKQKVQKLIVEILKNSSKGASQSYFDETEHCIKIVADVNKWMNNKTKMVKLCSLVYQMMVEENIDADQISLGRHLENEARILIKEVRLISTCLNIVESKDNLLKELSTHIVLESIFFCALSTFRYITALNFVTRTSSNIEGDLPLSHSISKFLKVLYKNIIYVKNYFRTQFNHLIGGNIVGEVIDLVKIPKIVAYLNKDSKYATTMLNQSFIMSQKEIPRNKRSFFKEKLISFLQRTTGKGLISETRGHMRDFMSKSEFERSNIFVTKDVDDEMDIGESMDGFCIITTEKNNLCNYYLESYIQEYCSKAHLLLTNDKYILGGYHFCNEGNSLSQNSDIIMHSIMQSIMHNVPDIKQYLALIHFELPQLVPDDRFPGVPLLTPSTHKLFGQFWDNLNHLSLNYNVIVIVDNSHLLMNMEDPFNFIYELKANSKNIPNFIKFILWMDKDHVRITNGEKKERAVLGEEVGCEINSSKMIRSIINTVHVFECQPIPLYRWIKSYVEHALATYKDIPKNTLIFFESYISTNCSGSIPQLRGCMRMLKEKVLDTKAYIELGSAEELKSLLGQEEIEEGTVIRRLSDEVADLELESDKLAVIQGILVLCELRQPMEITSYQVIIELSNPGSFQLLASKFPYIFKITKSLMYKSESEEAAEIDRFKCGEDLIEIRHKRAIKEFIHLKFPMAVDKIGNIHEPILKYAYEVVSKRNYALLPEYFRFNLFYHFIRSKYPEEFETFLLFMNVYWIYSQIDYFTSYQQLFRDLDILISCKYYDSSQRLDIIKLRNFLLLIEETLQGEEINFSDFCSQLRSRVLFEYNVSIILILGDLKLLGQPYFKTMFPSLKENNNIETLITLPSSVSHIEISEDNKWVVVGTRSGLIFVYNLQTFAITYIFPSGGRDINTLGLSYKGIGEGEVPLVISGGKYECIEIWDARRGEFYMPDRELQGHGEETTHIAVEKESFVSTGANNVLVRWNIEGGTVMYTSKPNKFRITSMIILGSEGSGAGTGAGTEAAGSTTEVNGNASLKSLEGDAMEDSKRTVENENENAMPLKEFRVLVGYATGVIRVYDSHLVPILYINQHNDIVISLQVYLHKLQIFSFSKEGEIKIADYHTIRYLQDMSIFHVSHEDYKQVLILHTQGIMVSYENKVLRFYKINNALQFEEWIYFFDSNLTCGAKSSDEKYLLSGDSGGRVIIYDFTNKPIEQRRAMYIPSHKPDTTVNNVLITSTLRKTEHILSCSMERELKIWNRDTGTFIKKYNLSSFTNEHVTCCCLSKKQQMVFVGCRDTNIYMLDLEKGKLCVVFEGHWTKVTLLNVIPSSEKHFFSVAEKNIKVWDTVLYECDKNYNEHHSNIIYLEEDCRSKDKIITIGQNFEFKRWSYTTGSTEKKTQYPLEDSHKDIHVEACAVVKTALIGALSNGYIYGYCTETNAQIYQGQSFHQELAVCMKYFPIDSRDYLLIVTKRAAILYRAKIKPPNIPLLTPTKVKLIKVCSLFLNSKIARGTIIQDNKYLFHVFYTCCSVLVIDSLEEDSEFQSPVLSREASKEQIIRRSLHTTQGADMVSGNTTQLLNLTSLTKDLSLPTSHDQTYINSLIMNSDSKGGGKAKDPKLSKTNTINGGVQTPEAFPHRFALIVLADSRGYLHVTRIYNL